MKIDWKHIFNWDVSAIQSPQAVKKDGRVIGYKVVVTYKYHGRDEEFYSVDDEHLYRVWTGPQDAAQEAYRGHLRNMHSQIKRQTRRAR